jgi:hypothetical protein
MLIFVIQFLIICVPFAESGALRAPTTILSRQTRLIAGGSEKLLKLSADAAAQSFTSFLSRCGRVLRRWPGVVSSDPLVDEQQLTL